jgi:hypothetical protein
VQETEGFLQVEVGAPEVEKVQLVVLAELEVFILEDLLEEGPFGDDGDSEFDLVELAFV